MSIEFLYLDEPSMIKAGVLDMKKCVASMDEVFRLLGKKDYLMGGPNENSHGLMLWFPKEKRTEGMPVAGPDRRFMAMPAYLGGRFNVCGQKWYGSNVENKKKGLPRSILTAMINDVDTGAPLALMSANLLSSMRTGAVPGVGAKYLQRSDASVVGIIGAGVISRSCLLAIAETINNKKEARVYDLLPEKSEAFCKEMKELTGMDVHPVGTLEEAVRGCDIVSVAASGAKEVSIDSSWLKPGVVIEITGAVDLSEDCYLKNRVVMDNWKMHEEWLEEIIAMPELAGNPSAGHPSETLLNLVIENRKSRDSVVGLGDLIEHPEKGRANDDEIFIFLTGGMGVEDVAWGYDVYQEACRLGIGQKLSLWDKPHWA